MHIRRSDYLLARFARSTMPLQKWLGNIESFWMRERLDAVTIDRPVFITGLARSGTTILLEILSSVPGVATHRYRDFPFLMTPCLWNRYLNWFAADETPIERAHKDGIHITRESPEAFEEPIWQAFFPHVHDPRAIHRISNEEQNQAFATFFADHIRKNLLVRNGTRYLSKGNYNFARVEYLLSIFPESRFVIPIRHPISHVHSLVRQHRLFSQYASSDARVPKYLAAAGHYEFGPQRVPIRLSADGGDRVLTAWTAGDEYLGYAHQWAEVYGFIDSLRRQQSDIADKILVVRYEDLCSDPTTVLTAILEHACLDHDSVETLRERVKASRHSAADISKEVQQSVWDVTESVVGNFGYERGM